MILLLSAAFAADTPEWHADQARHFLKRGWYDDADAEVRAGLALSPEHVELNAICVDLARHEGEIERALRCAATGAAAPEGDLDTRSRLSQVEAWLRANFGFVEVRGPDGIERVKAPLVATSLLIDAELREAVAATDTRTRAGMELPGRLALPAGDYTLLGEPLHVAAGATAHLELPPTRFAAAAARGKRVDLGVGVAAFSGAELENQQPGLETELGFSMPVGPVRLAAAATWALRGYSGVGLTDEVSPWTFGGTVRVGWPLDLGGALVLVPGALLSGAMQPGLELACTPGDPPLACTSGRADGSELAVYATGFALVPAASVALELNLGRVVVGLRGGVGHVFAVLPNPGELDVDGKLVEWEADPGMLHGAVYRGATTFSVGF